MVGMKQLKFQYYSNNEIRIGFDDLPCRTRGGGDSSKARTDERVALSLEAEYERNLVATGTFVYRDKDGTQYIGNCRDGYERTTTHVRRQLDIISEVQDSPKPSNRTSRRDYGRAVRPTVFSRNARHRILEAGSLFTEVLAGTFDGYFVTLTLPGSTDAAYDALSRYSDYVSNCVLQAVRDTTETAWYFYVWELQGRGALHMHLFYGLPKGTQPTDTEQYLFTAWYSALQSVGDMEGIDLFKHRDGEYCTIKSYWQFNHQLVETSPAQYVSKYVSKDANAPANRKGKAFSSAKYFPRRWWGMSRSFTKLIEETRFDVTIEGLTSDQCVNIIAETEEFLSENPVEMQYEYYAEVGSDREKGTSIGTTWRQIRYISAAMFRKVANRFAEKVAELACIFGGNGVRFKYGSLRTTEDGLWLPKITNPLNTAFMST